MIFPKFGTKSEWGGNFGSFGEFSPGQKGSEVGCQIDLHGLTGRPTSDPFWSGENLSK